jgi:hypothetical protein
MENDCHFTAIQHVCRGSMLETPWQPRRQLECAAVERDWLCLPCRLLMTGQAWLTSSRAFWRYVYFKHRWLRPNGRAENASVRE